MREYHIRYLRAVNNPIRRKILRSLKNGNKTIMDLKLNTDLSTDTLSWHLNMLEHGFCVEKDVREGEIVYKLTQEGAIVNYLDK